MPITFKHIQTTALETTGSTSITFSALPQTYDSLIIYCSARAASGNYNTGTDINISVNSGSGSFGSGNTGYSYNATLGADTGSNRAFSIQGDTSQTYGFGFGRMDFVNYSSNSANKQFFKGSGYTSTANYYAHDFCYGKWSGSDPITSITFTSGSGNFATGTKISLYGIKNS